MAAVTDSLFYVGQKFSCFNDLENCKKEYEMSNFCNITMRDAKTLQSMMKYAPKKAARAKKELRYYSLRLCCTYGGKKFKKQGEGKRETESRKVDCGMCVRLILSDDGESLDVVEFSANHSNHIIGEIKDFKDTHNFFQPAAASTSTPPTLPMDFVDAFREVAEQLRSTEVVKSEESSSVVQEFPEIVRTGSYQHHSHHKQGMSGFLFGNVASLDVPQTADEDGLSISTRSSASKRTSSSLGSRQSKKGKYRKIYPVLDFKNLNGKRITTGRLFYLCSSLGKVRKVLLQKSKSEALVMMEKDKPAYEVIATFHGKTVWGTTLDVGLSKTEVLVKSEEARVVDYTNMTYEEFSSDSSDEEFDP